MNKICFGCGAKLQSVDSNLIGYIPKEKEGNASYCQRCFKLNHYGVNIPNKTPKKVDEILYLVNKDNKHTIFMVDFLSISDKVMNIYNKISGPKLLLVSKLDIIPKDIKLETIRKYIMNRYNVSNIKFISSNNNYGIDALLNYLVERKIYSSYILGLSNSGKSTLINKIIDKMGSKLNKITTSHNKNTTLDFIRLNICEDLTLIDSPGFIINTYNIEKKEKEKISPITYQMKDGDILRINDFYLKFTNKTNITLYSNYDLDIKKYYKEVNDFSCDYTINDNSDLVIQGLGFINIKNRTSLLISNLDSSLIEVRESIFQGDL